MSFLSNSGLTTLVNSILAITGKKKLSQLTTANKNSLVDAINEVDAKSGAGGDGLPLTLVADYNYHFAVSVNGDDNNDGTKEHPFRTLDKFFKTCQEINTVHDESNPEAILERQRRSDIRCDILTAGYYPVTIFSISNISIHIHSLTPGVQIDFIGNGSPVAFYDAHINFKGGVNGSTTAYHLQITGDYYADGGSAIFTDCDLVGRFRSYNAGTIFERCYIRYQVFYNASMKVSNCLFHSDSNEHPIVEMYGGLFQMQGSNNYLESEVTGSTFIKAAGSHIGIGAAMHTTSLTTPFTYVLNLEACTVSGARASITALYSWGKNTIKRGSLMSNNLLWYSSNDLTGAEDSNSATLKDNIGNYNTITFKVRGNDTSNYININVNVNNSKTPADTPVGFVDANGVHTATIRLNNTAFTLLDVSDTGFRVGAIYGSNV